jgi:hypothetical protein
MSDDSYTKEDRERDLSMVKAHCRSMSEHFDTVMVFATRTVGSSTINCRYGIGDFFARYGHCKLWLLREEQDGLGGKAEEDRFE